VSETQPRGPDCEELRWEPLPARARTRTAHTAPEVVAALRPVGERDLVSDVRRFVSRWWARAPVGGQGERFDRQGLAHLESACEEACDLVDTFGYLEGKPFHTDPVLMGQRFRYTFLSVGHGQASLTSARAGPVAAHLVNVVVAAF
jgi:hypothetical protein